MIFSENFFKKIKSRLNSVKLSKNFIATKPISASISKKASIVFNNGSIFFNIPQNHLTQNKTPGYITIDDNSRLICNGHFVFSSGCRLGVVKNAVLTLGSGYMNYDSKLYCFEKITIGNNVAIGENVIIRDSDNHSLSGQRHISAPIEICDNVWIGMNATILKGVTIGEGSVIAAGAVVTHDIPPHSLAAGVPAKVIRKNISWTL